jgi:23S rRNA (cytosine1962-C5)-methyltransferase
MGIKFTGPIEKALGARRGLLSEQATEAVRVFNGEGDGIPGLVVERLGPVLIAQLHEERLRLSQQEARSVVEELSRRLGAAAVYRKDFVRDRGRASCETADSHKKPEPWIGTAVESELIIREYDLRFLVRPYDGFSYGLFLDHRDNRRRVRESSAGRRVLNMFAYTCGFSVAAAAGGAKHVASVDLYKRYLEWGKRNFEINNLDLSPHRFYCSDAFEFYKRAGRQGLRYDMVILDPPTFSRQKRPARNFVLAEQLEPLCRGAIELLDHGGILLLATNDRAISLRQLEEVTHQAAGGRRCTVVERPSLPSDFAADPDYSKTIIARLD